MENDISYRGESAWKEKELGKVLACPVLGWEYLVQVEDEVKGLIFK